MKIQKYCQVSQCLFFNESKDQVQLVRSKKKTQLAQKASVPIVPQLIPPLLPQGKLIELKVGSHNLFSLVDSPAHTDLHLCLVILLREPGNVGHAAVVDHRHHFKNYRKTI